MSDYNEKEIDKNVLPLVQALNAFDGISTIGSCGGHQNPKPGQYPAGSWYIKLTVDRSDDGHFALEFLAWLINNDLRQPLSRIAIYPTAPPPWWNEPGRVLSYVIESNGEDPEYIASLVKRAHETEFISPQEMKEYEAERA